MLENEKENTKMAKLMADNERIKKELKRAQEENRKLKHVLAYGNISTLETLIEQYMEYSRVHLKKIVMEIQLTDYETESYERVKELIEHLEYVKLEIEKLIEVNEEGFLSDNEKLQKDVKMAKKIIQKLEELVHIRQLEEDKSERLQEVLQKFQEDLKEVTEVKE